MDDQENEVSGLEETPDLMETQEVAAILGAGAYAKEWQRNFHHKHSATLKNAWRNDLQRRVKQIVRNVLNGVGAKNLNNISPEERAEAQRKATISNNRPENRKRNSEQAARRMQTPERRAYQSELAKRKMSDPAMRRHISACQINRMQDPLLRAKSIAGLQKGNKTQKAKSQESYNRKLVKILLMIPPSGVRRAIVKQNFRHCKRTFSLAITIGLIRKVRGEEVILFITPAGHQYLAEQQQEA
jgi:hypothetical protein